MLDTLHRVQRNRELNGEQGFTLIELLIVIVVLGILAAIVVFALGGVTGQSAVAACTADAKTVSIAVSAEQAQTPNIAPSQASLVPTYLKSWPSNPTYYSIGLSSDGNGVVEVKLAANDPGLSGTAGTPLPVAMTAAGDGSLYEADGATGAFTYGATVAASGNNAGLQGAGVCSGA